MEIRERMKLTLENLHMHADEVGKCLIWRGALGSHGYPQARLGGRTQLVRAYVYRELMGVELLAGRRITSRCGNPLCISSACISQATAGQLLARSYSSGARSKTGEYLTRLRRAQVQRQADLPPRVPRARPQAQEQPEGRGLAPARAATACACTWAWH